MLISLGVVAVVIVIGVVFVTRRATAPAEVTASVSPGVVASSTPKPSVSVSPIPSGVKTYTLADVALHPNQDSCWAVINGSVYDLTAWIKQHPGGASRILSICGKDGSVAFTNKHDSNQKQQDILKTFLIGKLTL